MTRSLLLRILPEIIRKHTEHFKDSLAGRNFFNDLLKIKDII
jgi:hypothetical protein